VEHAAQQQLLAFLVQTTVDCSSTAAVLAMPGRPCFLHVNHAGAGKTLIAADVIRRKLPALKAATKAVLFMAPTNPLVAQVGVHMCGDCALFTTGLDFSWCC